MKLKTFKEIVDEAGYELESYSGRGMFGDLCASIRLDKDQSVFEVLSNITEAAHVRHNVDGPGEVDVDDFDIGEWIELMGKTKTDNLGLGMVLYWKRMAWDESDDLSED